MKHVVGTWAPIQLVVGVACPPEGDIGDEAVLVFQRASLARQDALVALGDAAVRAAHHVPRVMQDSTTEDGTFAHMRVGVVARVA